MPLWAFVNNVDYYLTRHITHRETGLLNTATIARIWNCPTVARYLRSTFLVSHSVVLYSQLPKYSWLNQQLSHCAFKWSLAICSSAHRDHRAAACRSVSLLIPSTLDFMPLSLPRALLLPGGVTHSLQLAQKCTLSEWAIRRWITN